MDLLGELVGYLLFKPFISFCQALAGILTPTGCVRLVRLQKLAAIVLVLGATCVLTGFVGFSFSANGWFCLSVLVTGWVLLVISGAVGHHVQTKTGE